MVETNNRISASPPRRINVIVLTLMISVITVTALWMVSVASASRAEVKSQSNILATASPEQDICPVDIISYWHFDETTGTVFTDSIQALNGSCSGNGCPAFATGKVNGALAFDGISDRVTAPDDPDFEWVNGDSFSLELWVKTPGCDNKVFFGKHSFDASWWLGCGVGGSLPVFSLRDSEIGEGIRITATTAINDGNWHHLVAMRDGVSKQNRLYVDGVLEASTSVNYSGDFYNSNPLTFGHHFNAYFANATLDEVAAYNRILSASEVDEHYQSGLIGDGYCNASPMAADGSYVTDVDVALPITLTYSDSDGPGPYTFAIVDQPDHGSLSGSGANRTFTPAAGYVGSDSFKWRVNDGMSNSNVATIGILVSEGAENQAPVANSQAVTTDEDTPVGIQLTYSDPDGGPGPYTISIVDGPDHGSLSGSGVNRTYTPNPGYYGADSFTWRVNDGLANSNVATVSISVNEVTENQAPVADSQTVTTDEDTPVALLLTYTDLDGGPGPYTITIVNGPDHGSLSGSGTNRTYTPDSGYTGADFFTWRVNDGLANSNVATVTLQVNAGGGSENEPPVAESQTVSTQQGVPLSIQLQYDDPDGGPGPYTISILSDPANGTLSGSGVDLVYTPDPGFSGTDYFTWSVNDGASNSNSATVTINVSSTDSMLWLPLFAGG